MQISELSKKAATALEVENLTPLSRGGQKAVFLGESRGRKVAVKIVPTPPPHQKTVLERARREVSLLAGMADDHIVKVVSGLALLGDQAGPDGVAWLEEYVPGQDLSDLVGRPWTVPSIVELGEQISRALLALHVRRVVHRDLSAGNVRRRDDGTWILMDPGLARHLSEEAITGIFQPGTDGFRSPEHVPGGSPTPASDVFCVGILLYLAATGFLPCDPGADSNDYYRRLREDQIPSVKIARVDISSELADIIDTCLNRQSARRYLDAEELCDEFAKLPSGGRR